MKKKKVVKSPVRKAIESLAWRSGAAAVIAMLAYILNIGSIWSLDGKMLVDIGIIAAISLIGGELTKMINNSVVKK